jgi:hypothetical protein
MSHALRLRLPRHLSLVIVATGLLIAMSMSLAAPPSTLQARLINTAAGAGWSATEPFAAAVPSSNAPSAFGYLEFDWSEPDAVPGFGPWGNQTASATRTEIARAD